MFYQKDMDKAYRFGDIVRGYIISNTNIVNPFFEGEHFGSKYKIDISYPKYCVILTPCCSIGEKTILLSPLIKIHPSLCKNPYLAENLLRINLTMEPEQSVPPDVWGKLPEEEIQKRLSAGKAYAFYQYFIYDKNQILPEYSIGAIEVGFYMIDFRNIYKIHCDKIPNQQQVPLEAKCLQLSINVRKELREKISYYFYRPAPEDEIELE
jgi:hypothetical protein